MATRHPPIIVHLANRATQTWSPRRHGEPITIGIPLPRSAAAGPEDLALHDRTAVIPAQIRVLDRWSDGSMRWALLDFQADSDPSDGPRYWVGPADGDSAPTVEPVRVRREEGIVEVSTGALVCTFAVGAPFPVSEVAVAGRRVLEPGLSGVEISAAGQICRCLIREVLVREKGPLRAELEVRGAIQGEFSEALDVFARVELFAGSPTVRFDLTLRNRRRAQHARGQWSLGDPGSVLLDSLTWPLTLTERIGTIHCAPEHGGLLDVVNAPFEIYQASSGGAHWNSRVHVDREGRIPLPFAGYRFRSGTDERFGQRASPIVSASSPAARLTVTMPQFWQNFPRAIHVDGATIELGLFPRQHGSPHELQGGEQKTHTIVLAFAEDGVSDTPLAWCHEPSWIGPSPEWLCGSEALPFLLPVMQAPDAAYQKLVDGALDPMHGFVAKRELIDEYGWRHFGDLFADHESAFRQPGESLLVSHYNNQYDAIAGFVLQLFRTGDHRWWQLMVDLARHVRDIDIYHTDEDRPAYNHGLFWHTAHYVDAGTATHRTYTKGGSLSGGPSAEHNYSHGLMLHYFLTGDPASRDAAVELGQWVLDMDDGRRTPLRWLAASPTGLASATGSWSYHGPGRGAANSVLACWCAFRLTQQAGFAEKMEELIRRCIGPNDDIEGLNLPDVERRWYYTVFLQAIGAVLDDRQERGQFDHFFAYMRASLLHYARWMARHERPYLEKPEILEFPNQTWAAQDCRKAEVFMWAALHADGAERVEFLERARFFRHYSVDTVMAMPGRYFTRPLTLLLSNGVRWSWFDRPAAALPQAPAVKTPVFDSSSRTFVGQRSRAMRRAKLIVAAGAAGALLIALLLALA